MPTLYELGYEYLRLRELLEAEDLTQAQGEELAALFADNADAESHKSDGYRKVLAELAADESALDTEIERLVRRKQTVYRAQERLKENIRRYLITTEKHELSGALGKFTLRTGSQRIDVHEEDKIPYNFWRYVPESKHIDKVALRDAIKSGQNIPGVELVTGDPILLVR